MSNLSKLNNKSLSNLFDQILTKIVQKHAKSYRTIPKHCPLKISPKLLIL
jgi:hypothetical protein